MKNMRTGMRLLRYLLAIPIMLIVFSITPVQAQTTEVAVNAPAHVSIGQEFNVRIDIMGVVNFDAGQFDISVDKSMVELVSINNGQVNNTEIPVAIWNEITPGTYRVVLNVPGVPGVTGSGYLAVLCFQSLGYGESTFSISNGFLNDNKAMEIAATWASSSSFFFRPGDANNDSRINTADITTIERVIALLQTETPGADANQDKRINTQDITTVERMIIGL